MLPLSTNGNAKIKKNIFFGRKMEDVTGCGETHGDSYFLK
jgi:hypothetical protein